MKNILTPEEKSLLRSGARYLRSRGAREGSVEIEIEGSFDDADDIKFQGYFDNLYNVEIPNKLIPIFEKIFEYVIQQGLYRYPDVESLNYEKVVLEIDAVSQVLRVEHWYSYYDTEESSTRTWKLGEDYDDVTEDPLNEVFQTLENDSDIKPRRGILQVNYNGSGDSGYIEDYFEIGEGSIPDVVSDWCYRELENSHGGWEINEGSQGDFTFDLKNKEVELNHTYNTEENTSDTLLEFNFGN